jgi:predicted nucleic acid-binding protein
VITAVDTSVLLDVFGADPSFGERSREALRGCQTQGALVACEVVWAEVSAGFRSPDAAADALGRLRVGFSALDAASALAAGKAFGEYRSAGGSRERVVADFLVGAHARAHADRLLTRDRGYYRRFFQGLPIIDPSAVP